MDGTGPPLRSFCSIALTAVQVAEMISPGHPPVDPLLLLNMESNFEQAKGGNANYVDRMA